MYNLFWIITEPKGQPDRKKRCGAEAASSCGRQVTLIVGFQTKELFMHFNEAKIVEKDDFISALKSAHSTSKKNKNGHYSITHIYT